MEFMILTENIFDTIGDGLMLQVFVILFVRERGILCTSTSNSMYVAKDDLLLLPRRLVRFPPYTHEGFNVDTRSFWGCCRPHDEQYAIMCISRSA